MFIVKLYLNGIKKFTVKENEIDGLLLEHNCTKQKSNRGWNVKKNGIIAGFIQRA